MKHLQKPDMSVKDIVTDCAEHYRSEDLSEKLRNAANSFAEESTRYDLYAEEQKLHSLSPKDEFEGLTKKQMTDLYDSKFVQQKEVRVKYYDKLILGSADGRCPICGVGEVSTLDHFLPKSVYPVYSVTPYNLLPICYDCNRQKDKYVFTAATAMPLHPYYDYDDTVWLKCELKLENNQLVPSFCVSDEVAEPTLSRLKTFFELYALKSKFEINATADIIENKYLWKKISDGADTEKLKEYFDFCVISKEAYQKNSWNASLYRALAENTDLVKNYLDI